MPGAFELGARQKKHFAVAEQRVGDRDLLAAAPHPHQDHGVGVGEDQHQRVGEGTRLQGAPVEPLAFGAQPEFVGERREPGRRHGRPVDEVAPADHSDIGVDAVLDAEPKQAREPGLARNAGIGGIILALGGGRLSGAAVRCGRRPRRRRDIAA